MSKPVLKEAVHPLQAESPICRLLEIADMIEERRVRLGLGNTANEELEAQFLERLEGIRRNPLTSAAVAILPTVTVGFSSGNHQVLAGDRTKEAKADADYIRGQLAGSLLDEMRQA